MSRCEICNYCPDTDSPSLFESGGAGMFQTVKYRKHVDQDLCNHCWAHIQAARRQYRSEAMTPRDWNKIDVVETSETNPPWEESKEQEDEEVETGTPALSEV
jgi:hypothetical protein